MVCLLDVISTSSGKAKIILFPAFSEGPGFTFKLSVYDFFLNFLIDSSCDRLGGPCARCGVYYVKRSVRERVYCSKLCGARETSRLRNEKSRHLLHKKRLARANHYISKWLADNNHKLDCKAWVHKAARLSKHWLTSAEKSGALAFPVAR